MPTTKLADVSTLVGTLSTAATSLAAALLGSRPSPSKVADHGALGCGPDVAASSQALLHAAGDLVQAPTVEGWCDTCEALSSESSPGLCSCGTRAGPGPPSAWIAREIARGLHLDGGDQLAKVVLWLARAQGGDLLSSRPSWPPYRPTLMFAFDGLLDLCELVVRLDPGRAPDALRAACEGYSNYEAISDPSRHAPWMQLRVLRLLTRLSPQVVCDAAPAVVDRLLLRSTATDASGARVAFLSTTAQRLTAFVDGTEVLLPAAAGMMEAKDKVLRLHRRGGLCHGFRSAGGAVWPSDREEAVRLLASVAAVDLEPEALGLSMACLARCAAGVRLKSPGLPAEYNEVRGERSQITTGTEREVAMSAVVARVLRAVRGATAANAGQPAAMRALLECFGAPSGTDGALSLDAARAAIEARLRAFQAQALSPSLWFVIEASFPASTFSAPESLPADLYRPLPDQPTATHRDLIASLRGWLPELQARRLVHVALARPDARRTPAEGAPPPWAADYLRLRAGEGGWLLPSDDARRRDDAALRFRARVLDEARRLVLSDVDEERLAGGQLLVFTREVEALPDVLDLIPSGDARLRRLGQRTFDVSWLAGTKGFDYSSEAARRAGGAQALDFPLRFRGPEAQVRALERAPEPRDSVSLVGGPKEVADLIRRVVERVRCPWCALESDRYDAQTRACRVLKRAAADLDMHDEALVLFALRDPEPEVHDWAARALLPVSGRPWSVGLMDALRARPTPALAHWCSTEERRTALVRSLELRLTDFWRWRRPLLRPTEDTRDWKDEQAPFVGTSWLDESIQRTVALLARVTRHQERAGLGRLVRGELERLVLGRSLALRDVADLEGELVRAFAIDALGAVADAEEFVDHVAPLLATGSGLVYEAAVAQLRREAWDERRGDRPAVGSPGLDALWRARERHPAARSRFERLCEGYAEALGVSPAVDRVRQACRGHAAATTLTEDLRTVSDSDLDLVLGEEGAVAGLSAWVVPSTGGDRLQAVPLVWAILLRATGRAEGPDLEGRLTHDLPHVHALACELSARLSRRTDWDDDLLGPTRLCAPAPAPEATRVLALLVDVLLAADLEALGRHDFARRALERAALEGRADRGRPGLVAAIGRAVGAGGADGPAAGAWRSRLSGWREALGPTHAWPDGSAGHHLPDEASYEEPRATCLGAAARVAEVEASHGLAASVLAASGVSSLVLEAAALREAQVRLLHDANDRAGLAWWDDFLASERHVSHQLVARGLVQGKVHLTEASSRRFAAEQRAWGQRMVDTMVAGRALFDALCRLLEPREAQLAAPWLSTRGAVELAELFEAMDRHTRKRIELAALGKAHRFPVPGESRPTGLAAWRMRVARLPRAHWGRLQPLLAAATSLELAATIQPSDPERLGAALAGAATEPRLAAAGLALRVFATCTFLAEADVVDEQRSRLDALAEEIATALEDERQEQGAWYEELGQRIEDMSELLRRAATTLEPSARLLQGLGLVTPQLARFAEEQFMRLCPQVMTPRGPAYRLPNVKEPVRLRELPTSASRRAAHERLYSILERKQSTRLSRLTEAERAGRYANRVGGTVVAILGFTTELLAARESFERLGDAPSWDVEHQYRDGAVHTAKSAGYAVIFTGAVTGNPLMVGLGIAITAVMLGWDFYDCVYGPNELEKRAKDLGYVYWTSSAECGPDSLDHLIRGVPGKRYRPLDADTHLEAPR